MGTRQGLNKRKQGGGTKGAHGQHQQRQSLVLRQKTHKETLNRDKTDKTVRAGPWHSVCHTYTTCHSCNSFWIAAKNPQTMIEMCLCGHESKILVKSSQTYYYCQLLSTIHKKCQFFSLQLSKCIALWKPNIKILVNWMYCIWTLNSVQ